MSTVTFTKNMLRAAPSIGTSLRSRREAFGLALSDVEAALNISKRNIASLESDRFEDIPEDLYRALFLKNYSTYLGFEWSEVSAAYRSQTLLYHPHLESGPAAPKKDVHRSLLWVPARMVKNAGLASIMGACALYLAFLGYSIVSAPRLDVISPSDTMTVHQASVLVSGRTQGDADIVINGLPVIKERDGSFQQEVTLAEGANVIRVTAAKKYSKEIAVERTIFFRKENVSVKEQISRNNF